MLIPIVNEDDEIIGYKERNEIQTEDTYRIAALWIVNEFGETLLTQRAATKSHNPDKRTVAVNGTVEQGETYEENIIHETQEEIGISISSPHLILKEKSTSAGWTHFVSLFLIQLPKATPFVFDPREVQATKRVSLVELEQRLEEKPDDFVGSFSSYMEAVKENLN
jgi:isopentenyldiphosphate isomerase